MISPGGTIAPLFVLQFTSNQPSIMALYSQATDLTTRQTVWISTNVVKDRPQLNSHRGDNVGESLRRSGVDGLSAVELADLHTDGSACCPISGWRSNQWG